MSDSLHSQEHAEPNLARSQSPATGNPLGDAEEQPKTMIGTNIAQDLMSVYESLTQSSNPQTLSNHGSQKSNGQQSQFEPPLANHQQFASQEQPMQGHRSNQSHSMQQFQAPEQAYQHHHHQPPPQNPQVQQHYQQAPQKPFYGAFNPFPQFAPPAQGFTPADQPSIQPSSDEVDSDDMGMESRTRKKRSRSSSNSTGSNNTKGRKKGKNSDGRWSKRFTWPEDLHRDFVSAIFDVGLKHSSPSTIIEHMPKNPDITTERIKSHLQKYRIHRAKSKQEFMSSYEASLVKFQKKGLAGVQSLSNGDAAAHLAYTATVDPNKLAAARPEKIQPQPDRGQSNVYAPRVNEALLLPQLTEAEKNSPIGASMGYLMGLFFSLKQQLAHQRSIEGSDKVNVMVAVAENKAPPIATNEKSRDSPQQLDGRSSPAPEDTPISSHPSSSRNLEVNSHMKREMQNQMVFQKKLRALKQEQLNKSKNGKEDKDGNPLSPVGDGMVGQRNAEAGRGQVAGDNAGQDGTTGENARNRGLSLSHSEDFWNTDVVDEQLFEFLMNN
eukprot:scaffold20012_cov179-Cylindrotheca_fusiformis.AAC.3